MDFLKIDRGRCIQEFVRRLWVSICEEVRKKGFSKARCQTLAGFQHEPHLVIELWLGGPPLYNKMLGYNKPLLDKSLAVFLTLRNSSLLAEGDSQVGTDLAENSQHLAHLQR